MMAKFSSNTFKIPCRFKGGAGFTLIEVLVVIAIIAILATIAMVGTKLARDAADQSAAKADIDTIRKAIESLATDTGEWPGHQPPEEVCACANNELEDLTIDEAGLVGTDGNYENWDGPYIGSLHLDPWGNNYFFDTDYDIDGTDQVVVGSYGPNGVGLNQYDSDDIIRIMTHQ